MAVWRHIDVRDCFSYVTSLKTIPTLYSKVKWALLCVKRCVVGLADTRLSLSQGQRPGLWVQTLAANRKLELGVPSDKLALEVRGVFGADVQRAGLRKNDIIVGFGGRDEHLTDGQFHAALRLSYFQPGAQLKLRVLRDRRPRELEVGFVKR